MLQETVERVNAMTLSEQLDNAWTSAAITMLMLGVYTCIVSLSRGEILTGAQLVLACTALAVALSGMDG